MSDEVHVIAEGAVNHFGSVEAACSLIDAAHEAGADSLKLQVIFNDELYLEGQYEYGPYDIADVRKQREDASLNRAQYEEVFRYAEKVGMDITASVFGHKATDLLAQFDVPFIKIASGELNNHRLIDHVASTGRKLILSTGMSSLDDVKRAVQVVEKHPGVEYVLMHCIAIYPHEEAESQLGYMKTLQAAFPVEVGYSDHTLGTAAASAAVALGARWIEKHFTLDRSRGGLDAKHSLEPAELTHFVRTVKGVDAALRIRDRELSSAELLTRRRARRGLYAARALPPGAAISEADVLVLRPEGALPADTLDQLVGRETHRQIARLEPFLPEDLS